MSEQEKMDLLEEVFDFDKEEVSPDTVLAENDWWDTLSKLSLVVMFEDEFGCKIDRMTK